MEKIGVFDFMNIGNMINSKWGVMKNASSSNGCRILKYEGMDDNKTPIFSMDIHEIKAQLEMMFGFTCLE